MHVLFDAHLMLGDMGRGDGLDDRPLHGAACGEDFPCFAGTGLGHGGAAVGLDVDDALHGQALQRSLHVVAVGLQGLDDVRLDQPHARAQAMLGNGLGEHLGDALDFLLLATDRLAFHRDL
ncbi:hypothetical protein D3C79_756480 [compost metagenome]